jgi:hypothetical protein
VQVVVTVAMVMLLRDLGISYGTILVTVFITLDFHLILDRQFTNSGKQEVAMIPVGERATKESQLYIQLITMHLTDLIGLKRAWMLFG